MESDFPYLRILLFLLVFTLFLAPGYLWACWLSREEKFAAPLRCVLGFAWSMTFFGAVGWPFLWFGWSFRALLGLLYPLWGVLLITGTAATLYLRRRQSPEPKESHSAAQELSEVDRRPMPSFARVCCVLASCLGVATVAGAIWPDDEPWSRLVVLLFAPAFGVVAALGARWLRRNCLSSLRFTKEDDRPAYRLWSVAAIALILLQAGSAVVYDRPDWDDAFYLSAVLDYQHSESLNSRHPVTREPSRMTAIYRALCWELWGSVVCTLTGLHAMALFHSLLPGILVLLAYSAYAGLFSEYLPRRWVPLALLGLSAFHLWGISDHTSAANHFLSRIWQGKSVLLHIGVPLTIVLLTRYLSHPTPKRWLLLCGSILFGLAVSFSAIFMLSALCACLGLALALSEGMGRRTIRALLGAALAAAPLVVCGLVVRASPQSSVGPGDVGQPLSEQPPWVLEFVKFTRSGSAEIVWLFTLPLMAVLVRDRRRWAYFVLFPVLLALTFANPFLYHLVATQFTSYYGYYRILWLFPVGTGLGALLALTVRFLLRCGNVSAERLAVAGLALASAGLALSFALPGIYVWGTRNTLGGVLGTPRLAENLEKIPSDLVPLARRLAEDPAISQVRILCDLEVSSYLAPYSLDFRLVQTRPTPFGHSPPERRAAGLEPYLMTVVLQKGRFPPLREELSWQLPHTFTLFEWKALEKAYGEKAIAAVRSRIANDPEDYLREMLQYHKVKYLVIGPDDEGAAMFRQVGCQLVCQRGEFSLWQVPESILKGSRGASQQLEHSVHVQRATLSFDLAFSRPSCRLPVTRIRAQ
jgi:hypothetical protein